jgi:carboxylesterase type B
LTASPLANKGDLFQKAWVSNGAGAFENKTLSSANAENKVILDKLNCGSDEVECLIDATAEDLTEAMPYEWRDSNQPELPQVGEKEHSWIIVDKTVLRQHPMDYWSGHQLSNNIPLVFGATAQGEVTADSKEFLDWSDTDKFEAHVESKLGSFNVSIPGSAMERYNVSDHWQEYASMISDIRTVCPLQELAQYVSGNFVADVYSYVASQKRQEPLGGIADQTVDIAAILGTYQTEDPEELKFIDNMNDMFFNFVNTGKLPKDQDLTKGMYIVDSEIKTQGSYPNCDFWKKAQQIVPTYAALD